MASLKRASFGDRPMIPRAFWATKGEPPAKRPRGEKVVSVNVGGRVFTTTNTTLCKSPFFVDLFDQINNRKTVTRDDLGNPFVNRNADAFDEVMKFLQTGVLPTVKYKYKLLDPELDYFGITYLLPVPEGHESDECRSDDASEADDEDDVDVNGNLVGLACEGKVPAHLWRKEFKTWCAAARAGFGKKGKKAKK